MFLTYNNFVRQYIHEDLSNHYTMHHLNGCSLHLYEDAIHYNCSNIKKINLDHDLSMLINHFGLKEQLKDMQSIQLILSGSRINFPVLLQSINKSRKWPKDFRKTYEKGGRGEYLELIANVINSSGYIERLGQIFSEYGCKPKLYRSGTMDFMEYHSDNGFPLFYKSEELIQRGLIEREKNIKKVYPMIDLLSLSCD